MKSVPEKVVGGREHATRRTLHLASNSLNASNVLATTDILETFANLMVRLIALLFFHYCHDSCLSDQLLPLSGPCTELRFEGDAFPWNENPYDLVYYDGANTLMVHGRPVYGERSDYDWPTNVILFDGGHWLAMSSDKLGETAGSDLDGLKEYLAANFSSLRHTGIDYDYVSVEANVGSPSLFTDTRDREYYTLCADCKPEKGAPGSYCRNQDGLEDTRLCKSEHDPIHKRSDNRCDCPDGFAGPLCQTREFPVCSSMRLFLHISNTALVFFKYAYCRPH